MTFAYVSYVTRRCPCCRGQSPNPCNPSSDLRNAKKRKLKFTKYTFVQQDQRSLITCFIHPLSYDLLLFDRYLIKHLSFFLCAVESCHEVAEIHEMPCVGWWHESVAVSAFRDREECKPILVEMMTTAKAILNPFILATVSQHIFYSVIPLSNPFLQPHSEHSYITEDSRNSEAFKATNADIKSVRKLESTTKLFSSYHLKGEFEIIMMELFVKLICARLSCCMNILGNCFLIEAYFEEAKF